MIPAYLTEHTYRQATDTLLNNVPDYISVLIASDYIHLNVEGNPVQGPPALAWTNFDDKQGRWVVHMRPEAAEMSNDAQQTLWRHEVGHIFFAHFSKQPCMPENPGRSIIEALQVGDLQINYYLIPHKDAMDEIGSKNREAVNKMLEARTGQLINLAELGDKGPGWLNPETVYPQLNLPMAEYPFDVIHAYLHQKLDEEEQAGGQGAEQGWCGGIEAPGEGSEGTAEATASVISSVAAEGEKEFGGKEWGTEHSMGEIRLRDSDLPDWLPALEAFARARVEVVLADTRSHTRPQDIYAKYDVHMPTMRPRWAYKPNTVCFLVDTSGSMYNELKYVMPVVSYLNQHDIAVRLIAGDTQVTYDEELKPGDTLPSGVGGGGGTEITPLFDKAYEYEPESMVVFSDGYVARFPEDRGVPTLWVGAQTGLPSWVSRA